MYRTTVWAGIAALLAMAVSAHAESPADQVKKGAQAYRICAACHSLQPGVHLSGPSLSGLWGKAPASLKDYGRYTAALSELNAEWDENTLNAWLAHPQEMAPGTTMAFRGVQNDETRVALIAFLRLAMAEGGHRKVVDAGLIPKAMAEGQIPPDLTTVAENQRVTAIRHCGDAYQVTTANGARFPFWETNVRLKIDTSKRGPKAGQIVLLRSGMAGDRVSVVFSSSKALREALTETCD